MLFFRPVLTLDLVAERSIVGGEAAQVGAGEDAADAGDKVPVVACPGGNWVEAGGGSLFGKLVALHICNTILNVLLTFLTGMYIV